MGTVEACRCPDRQPVTLSVGDAVATCDTCKGVYRAVRPVLVDLSDVALQARAAQVVGNCRCHESYTVRKMIDPDCAWHTFAEEIFDALQSVRDGQRERDTGIAEQVYVQHKKSGKYPMDMGGLAKEIATAIRQSKGM